MPSRINLVYYFKSTPSCATSYRVYHFSITLPSDSATFHNYEVATPHDRETAAYLEHLLYTDPAQLKTILTNLMMHYIIENKKPLPTSFATLRTLYNYPIPATLPHPNYPDIDTVPKYLKEALGIPLYDSDNSEVTFFVKGLD